MKFSCVIGYKYGNADFLPSMSINLMSKSFYYSIIKDNDKGKSHAETLVDIPVFVKKSIITGFTNIDGDDVTKDVVLGMKVCKKYSIRRIEPLWEPYGVSKAATSLALNVIISLSFFAASTLLIAPNLLKGGNKSVCIEDSVGVASATSANVGAVDEGDLHLLRDGLTDGKNLLRDGPECEGDGGGENDGIGDNGDEGGDGDSEVMTKEQEQVQPEPVVTHISQKVLSLKGSSLENFDRAP
uniref:Uncharacterized protein n=1 Tax=Tanacetum cinerariifolium TaxID=118510 RepID=A0A6L2P246_TANCI|nr:hypothetical protein [Tanacetum cinerariifolium]